MKRARPDQWRKTRLRVAIDQSPLSQAALARAVKCSPATIANALEGRRISRKFADRIEMALGCPPGSLFEDVDDEPVLLSEAA